MFATRPSISLSSPHPTHLFILTVALLCIPASASGRFVSQLGETRDVHISFPVIHRRPEGYRVIARQALDFGAGLGGNSTPASSTPSSGELRSELITLDEPLGQYFAVLQLGTPAKEIAVIIDTGSEFLWVQCLPCTQCGKQIRDPIFDPAGSTTYRYISCVSTSCPADDSVAGACDLDTGACSYKVTYGDNSTSTGILSEETLTFGTTKGAPFQLTEVVFGCGNINTGIESSLNASGLMGLDRGNFSIPSQLGVDKFSYCLPDRVKDVHSSGYITFGNSTVSEKLQYTPLLQNDASSFSSQFYYLNLTGVSVNQSLVVIPSSAFEMDDAGNGGTVIDSGTSLTSFVDVAYTAVADAFESAMNPSVTKADLGDAYGLCYKVPKYQEKPPDAPSVTLHFDGPVDVELQTDHLLRLVGYDTTYNYYCMAFNNAGSDETAKNFIGNYQQQNFLVEYDVGNSRIGFAPTQCTSSASSINRWNVNYLSLFGIFQTIIVALVL